MKSKYIENTFENNHTKIWESYFDKLEMKWGYGCCHSIVRNSYCTGEAGKAVQEASGNLVQKSKEKELLRKSLPAQKEITKSTGMASSFSSPEDHVW